jgi:Arc/MetJ-type ribon-helix-helix transcriptional regulator
MVVRVSEFEREVERLRAKILDAYGEAVSELEELEEAVTRWKGPFRFGRLYHELEDIVDDLEEDFVEVKRRIGELRREAERRGDEGLRKAVDELDKLLEDKVKEFNARYEEVVRRIEESIPGPRGRRAHHIDVILALPHRLARIVTREVGETLKEALEEARRATEAVSTVISSIRLREEDARVIDELVEAGIFRSRSEAVAFFVRKGIEASREWLEKVRENIRKIRELQEEVRRELEGGKT